MSSSMKSKHLGSTLNASANSNQSVTTPNQNRSYGKLSNKDCKRVPAKRNKKEKPPMPQFLQAQVPFPMDISLTQMIPKLTALDQLVLPPDSPFDRIASEYFKVSDFKSHPKLSNASHLNTLSTAVDKIFSRKSILFCFDIEAYEMNTQLITEIGIAIYDPRGQQYALIPDIKQVHIIIKECSKLYNGRYVADNKDNFLGGPSLVMSAKEAVTFLHLLIKYYFVESKNGTDTVLVGHDVKGDIKWLSSLGLNFPPNISVIDTQRLWSLTAAKDGSLGKILRRLNLPHAYLHNAGNDAYYTLLTAMNLSDPNIRTIHKLDQYQTSTDQENSTTNMKANGAKQKKRMKNRSFEVCDPIEVNTAIEAANEIFNTN